MKAEFTKEMRKTHTIYMPQMLHYHNDLLKAAFEYGGYKLEIVPIHDKYSKSTYSTINKDYCSCATGIVGNLLTFIENGECDSDKIAFLEPQAGGACRAGNYYNLIIRCLEKAGYGHIPVLSLNAHGLEKHSGFSINTRMLFAAVAGVCYSDLLMTLYQQVSPYEINEGDSDKLRKKWLSFLFEEIRNGRLLKKRAEIYRRIVDEFSKIPVDKSKKLTRVGIVGEIYIKFSPVGNYGLEEFLKKNGCEYRQGGFVNYCIYVVYSEMQSEKLKCAAKFKLWAYQKVVNYLCKTQREISEVIKTGGFQADSDFYDIKQYANDILSDYYNIGDGWLMTAETVDLIKQGYDKILIVHPFGCLVSHVGGRGVIKKIKEIYPKAHISSVEFDYDQSEALRESRILLALN